LLLAVFCDEVTLVGKLPLQVINIAITFNLNKEYSGSLHDLMHTI